MTGREGDMRIDIFVHTDAAPTTLDPRLDHVVNQLHTAIRGIATMSESINQLQAQIAQLQNDVAAENTVIAGATALINGFAAQLQAAIDHATSANVPPEALQALTDLHAQVTGATASLAAAVDANTQPTPTSTPAPEPAPGDPVATPPAA